MTREQKADLLQRMLGLKHKLKVHDSVKNEDSHEALAQSYLARWELEDEITAIEKLLEEGRRQNVQVKLKQIEQDYLSGKPKKIK